jgi:prepilin-type N-terminal cleavage/methylation domain-containing protein
MRRTSTIKPGPDIRALGAASSGAGSNAGYSLLEMLIVLAIMAVAMAIVVPRGAVMMDRVVTHAVFFDFQRQMSDLRRDAFNSQSPLTVYASGGVDPQDPQGRAIPLRASWSYRLARPIRISEGGACSPTSAEILRAGQVIMHLNMADQTCHFIRLD